MIEACWPDSGLLNAIQNLERADREQRWHEYVSMLRELTPKILLAAEKIETSWYDLKPNQQEEAIKLKAIFDEAVRQQNRTLSFGERTRLVSRSLWFFLHQTQLWGYTYASMRLMIAIDRALSNETRRRNMLLSASQSKPELVLAIQRGEQEFNEGLGDTYSREEFDQRFTFG